MNARSLLLAFSLAAASGLRAGESQTIDLGNGTTLEVRDGKVSVRSQSNGDSGGNNSAKTSTSSRTDSSGTTTATVVSERNGQRVTRQVTIGKDGKVTITDPDQPGKPPESPASQKPAGGWLGVHTVPVSDALRDQLDIPDGQGIVVEFVAAGGPAENGGVRANDLILKLNGQPVTSVESFREQLRALNAGQMITLDCLRKGKPVAVSATMGSRPADAPPGDEVTSEAERLLREMQAKHGHGSHSRIVVEENGNTRVVESDDAGGDAFDLLLKDPNVPEQVKEQLRKTQEEFKKARSGQPGK